MSTKRLNDTIVPEAAYLQASTISRNGGKVFLVVADDRAQRPHHCGNCMGTGAVGLQYFTGGPYDNEPPIQNYLPNANNPNDVPARLTMYNGKWYKQKTRTWSCPVCQGTGIGQRKQERVRELAL